MKLNQDKYHLLLFGCKHENVWSQTEVVIICKSKLISLLRNKNLNLMNMNRPYAERLPKKSQSLPDYLMKAFIKSQFR